MMSCFTPSLCSHSINNIKLTLAYDGSRYYGWQKTVDGPNIETTLQTALEKMLQHPIPLQAASRTDRGVHASGQVANFLTSKEIDNFDQFVIRLNSLLPKDIVALSAEKASPTFHPTLEATGKEYRYFVCLGPIQLPVYRNYSWHVYRSLNIDKIRDVLPLMLGTHNFASFCNAKTKSRYKNLTRNIQSLTLDEIEGCRLCFHISGNHFLYKMVRNMIGTLIDIGCGKLSPDAIADILVKEDRCLAGMTAPSHGLFLHQVFYE
jgi:tRNA pseudouridine38-40 synthase